MTRISGPLLIAIGALHLVAGLVFYLGPLSGIAGDGFFNAIDPAAQRSEREAAFWYMMVGIVLLILGNLVRWTQTRTGTLPSFVGWSVLGFGVLGIVLMPSSGFWLFLPQAALMIVVARRTRSRSDASDGAGASYSAAAR